MPNHRFLATFPPYMYDALFTDNARPPTDADLAAALGPAKRQWDALADHIAGEYPDAKPAWKYYAGKSGWQWVVRRKDRNFAYLKPLAGRFLFATALSNPATAAALESKLPADLIASIREASPSPEGRPARIIVSSPKSAAAAKQLLAIKAQH